MPSARIRYAPCDLSIDPAACYTAFKTTAFLLGVVEFGVVAFLLNILTFWLVKPSLRLKIFSFLLVALIGIEIKSNGWFPFGKALLAPAAATLFVYWLLMRRAKKKPRWTDEQQDHAVEN